MYKILDDDDDDDEDDNDDDVLLDMDDDETAPVAAVVVVAVAAVAVAVAVAVAEEDAILRAPTINNLPDIKLIANNSIANDCNNCNRRLDSGILSVFVSRP